MIARKALRLHDGRSLSFLEYGLAGGLPVLYFHGAPSAANEWQLFGGHELASRLNIRLIVPDRPGMGGSDPDPGRTLGAWPRDAEALADACGLERFAVLGYSEGTGYAAACAVSLPDLVTRCGLVAPVYHALPELEEGMDPRVLRIRRLARDDPRLGRLLLALTLGVPARVAPEYVIRHAMKALREPDRAILSRPCAKKALISMLRWSFRQGARGPCLDMALTASPWEFGPGAITVPVSIWQGTADSIGSTPAMAEYLHAAIAGSELTLLPEGHLSILDNHKNTILESLLS